ncbi:hypothetical protein RESH_04214 [Rhodopirellula europaea SH398]|uniref:Uncharacterized protein n=1 Tax=Rhodopirellula europaea SH398 TaxID=1263868 RepID=M5SC15_9BACT|nr:hypothetical protein RESH_04214 [Rhodopirellula europaea SH398]
MLLLEHRSGDGDSAGHTDNHRPARSSLAPLLVRVPALIRFGHAPPPRNVKQHCLGILRRTEQNLPGFFVPRWLQIPEYEQEWDRQWDRGPVRS